METKLRISKQEKVLREILLEMEADPDRFSSEYVSDAVKRFQIILKRKSARIQKRIKQREEKSQ